MADEEVEKLKAQVAALNRLVEVSLVLNSTLALDPLLGFIMDAAAELTGAEAASILLVDRRTNELFFAASTGVPKEKLAGLQVPLDGSIAGTILREKRPIVINDVSHDPRHYTGVDRTLSFKTRSLLGVPMNIKDRTIGVLEAVNKIEGKWTPEDTNCLSILAAQAAVAIENARLVEALQRAYDELDQLDKLKNDFIAVASHELRTPLGVILGYASFLIDEAEGEIGEHAAIVLDSALHLRNLIEEMTNLRYLQTGDLKLEKAPLLLDELLTELVREVESMASAKGQSINVNLPDEPCKIVADRARLAMAITNLLNNAIKFTPEGGRIDVSLARHGREVWVSVQDNGVGIPPHLLEKVFDRFFQVEDHMTRRHGGMGLGLSIAKVVVEAHGGRIWAESDGPGTGSVFTIALPPKEEEAT